MSKVTLNHMFESASGKLCKKGSTYVIHYKRSGKMVSAEYHNREMPDTEAQQQVKKTFTQRAKLAAAWWKANKPSAQNAEGTENYQLVMKAFASQHKFDNPYSYLRSLVTSELKVCLGDLDITGEITSGSGSTTTPTKPGGDGNLDG